MATIRDVAKLAGVAVCTVSRTINNNQNVLPETKEKVLRAIKELDYVPDELTRGVFRKKVGIIAMLVPSIRHQFFGSLAYHVEKELYVKGYKLMLCSADDQMEREQEYMRVFRSNLVDGVILCVTHLEDSVYENFGKPLVMLDYQVNEKIPVVVCDNVMGGELAAEVFIKNHRKHVLQIISESDKPVFSLKRHVALRAALEAAGVAVRDTIINWNQYDFVGYQDLSMSLLETHPEIDGIMAPDMPAAAFLKAAVRLGKRVPEDICVVAFDGTYLTRVNTLQITAITQPLDLMAEKIVEVISAQVDGKELEESLYIFPPTLTRGETG